LLEGEVAVREEIRKALMNHVRSDISSDYVIFDKFDKLKRLVKPVQDIADELLRLMQVFRG